MWRGRLGPCFLSPVCQTKYFAWRPNIERPYLNLFVFSDTAQAVQAGPLNRSARQRLLCRTTTGNRLGPRANGSPRITRANQPRRPQPCPSTSQRRPPFDIRAVPPNQRARLTLDSPTNANLRPDIHNQNNDARQTPRAPFTLPRINAVINPNAVLLCLRVSKKNQPSTVHATNPPNAPSIHSCPSAPRQLLRRYLPRPQLMRPLRCLRRIQLMHRRRQLPRPQLMHRRRLRRRQLVHRLRRRRLRWIIPLRRR